MRGSTSARFRSSFARGHHVEQQKPFPVYFRGQIIGTLIPDMIVDGKVIADPKVVSAFNENHIAQMLGYLNITGLEVAIVLNFKDMRLHWKRVVNERAHFAADGTDVDEGE
jgi:GxxExxY protein